MNLAEFANLTDAQIPAPPAFPEGWYMAVISGPWLERKAGDKTIAQFPIRLTAPLPDVDQQALAKVQGWNTRTLFVEFWLPDDGYRLTRHFFGKVLGLDPSTTLSERAAAAEGRTLKVQLKQKARRDPDDDRIDTVVGRTLPAEA